MSLKRKQKNRRKVGEVGMKIDDAIELLTSLLFSVVGRKEIDETVKEAIRLLEEAKKEQS